MKKKQPIFLFCTFFNFFFLFKKIKDHLVNIALGIVVIDDRIDRSINQSLAHAIVDYLQEGEEPG